MDSCNLLDSCGFFRKYQSSQSAACNAFIQDYCHGDKQDKCKRKEFRRLQGEPAPDNMLPVGGLLPDIL